VVALCISGTYGFLFTKKTTPEPTKRTTPEPTKRTTPEPTGRTTADPTKKTTAKPQPGDAKLWALLVAGSNYYYNYRHQSDVCHAYQILHAHGIPDERIIVMMYDDIANNTANPTKGIIVNHVDGEDVYHGVPKDYVGRDVTPKNFLNILQGNKDAVKGIGSGKVVDSGPNDHIFVNFVDHGATGILAFPIGELTVKQLNDAIKAMHENNRYGKLVFYIEACEAGSMFRNVLPTDINVFATTASDYDESSYACYYDNKRKTYLGDWYSVNWMEDSDIENLHVETLQKQFEITKNKTTTSHVKEYGDLSLSNLVVGEFQGDKDGPTRNRALPKAPFNRGVESYEVPLDILYKRLAAATTELEREELKQEIDAMIEKRGILETTVKKLVLVSPCRTITKVA